MFALAGWSLVIFHSITKTCHYVQSRYDSCTILLLNHTQVIVDFGRWTTNLFIFRSLQGKRRTVMLATANTMNLLPFRSMQHQLQSDDADSLHRGIPVIRFLFSAFLMLICILAKLPMFAIYYTPPYRVGALSIDGHCPSVCLSSAWS